MEATVAICLATSGHLVEKVSIRDLFHSADSGLTHDLTPPINPKLYPVAKSLPGAVFVGISRRSLK
jgi:hypothetical protein